MIYTFGNIKGGVGKSTLACNFAVHMATVSPEGSVLVIDGDKQATAVTFTEVRSERMNNAAGYACIRAQGQEVFSQVQTMRDKFQTIIIDAGGQDNPSLRVALASSDRVVIPFVPQSFEIWAVNDMAELVETAQMTNPRLKALSVINKGRSAGTANHEIKEYLTKEHASLNVIDPVLVLRQPWSDASGLGLSILEHRPKDGKAISEFNAVIDSIV